MASNTGRESSEAILVLIGYPGSGKSETGNTVIGKRVFKRKSPQIQETDDVFDLHLTVRDTTGFENMTEFVKTYKSLKDLDRRKVVFGLTIRIGRFDPGFTDAIKDIFNDRSVGEHLKRRTFLIFTFLDELGKTNEEIYEDKFEEWLRTADDIQKLITSFQLDYCVVLNEPGGTKRLKHVEQIVKHIQGILENGSEQETWYQFNEIVLHDLDKNEMDTPMPNKIVAYDFGENNRNFNGGLVGYICDMLRKDPEFSKKLDQELKITPRKVIDFVRTLQPIEDQQDRNKKIHAFLHDLGSHLTESDIDKLPNIEKGCFAGRLCTIL